MKVLLRRDQTALTREQTKKFIDAFALGYLTPCEQVSIIVLLFVLYLMCICVYVFTSDIKALCDS